MKNQPVMIVGVDRSGTTLLNMMMDSHPDIAIPYESKFFIRYQKKIESFGNLSKIKNRKALVDAILAEDTLKSWKGLVSSKDIDLGKCITLSGTINAIYSEYAKLNGKKYWGDKTPSYIKNIHILYSLFPDAYYIHLVRDGRDVASSIVQRWWGADDFISAIRYWNECVQTRTTRKARVFKTLCQPIVIARYGPPVCPQNESPVATA